MAQKGPFASPMAVLAGFAVVACANSPPFEPEEPNRCGGVLPDEPVPAEECPEHTPLSYASGCPLGWSAPQAASSSEPSSEPASSTPGVAEAKACSEPAIVTFGEPRPATADDGERLETALMLLASQDFDAACADLDDLFLRIPRPEIAFHLARCESARGHLLRAHRLFDAIVRWAPAGSVDAPPVPEARAALAELEGRLASLRVSVTLDGTAPFDEPPIVTVDEYRMGPEVLSGGMAIDPGVYRVSAWARCYEVSRSEIRVSEGESAEVALHLWPLLR
jgi:hypothetical protein